MCADAGFGQTIASRTLVAVVGPTAAGKSDLAVTLAASLTGEVISVDSMQIYRGMDIGTAKLSVPERAGITHHLLDRLDVTEPATVAEFQAWASATAARHDYQVRFAPVGPDDPEVGPPSQLAVFSR